MSQQTSTEPRSGTTGQSQSAVGSINFVITAIYTVTFANAIYRVAHVDNKNISIAIRDDAGASALACAAVCMIMALRYFFGNNNFMDRVFSSPEGAWARLYHFTVITTQSLVLLASSYLVANGAQFVRWFTALFVIEVGWYLGCLLFAQTSVFDESGRLSRSLLLNEASNAGVAGIALGALLTLRGHETALVWVVFAAFVVNTIVDMRLNLRGYMGL